MFFVEWFRHLKRDREQLYRVTGHLLLIKKDLAKLENEQVQKIDDIQYDNRRRIDFQQIQVNELYKSIEQITQELNEIKSSTSISGRALKTDIDNAHAEIKTMSASITALEHNSQSNDGGGR